MAVTKKEFDALVEKVDFLAEEIRKILAGPKAPAKEEQGDLIEKIVSTVSTKWDTYKEPVAYRELSAKLNRTLKSRGLDLDDLLAVAQSDRTLVVGIKKSGARFILPSIVMPTLTMTERELYGLLTQDEIEALAKDAQEKLIRQAFQTT